MLDIIVSEKSPLRDLPTIVESSMRMRIDALIYSADAISINWNRLRNMAISVGEDIDKINHLQRAEMLSTAWSIVDELDAIRQLVHGLINPEDNVGPFTQRLIKECEPVRALRNKMRHLSGNLRNLSQSKQNRSPLLGALSWFWCPHIQQGKGCSIVIQSGMLHGQNIAGFANPTNRDIVPPVDLFMLNAFGIVLEIYNPIVAFVEWIDASAQSWFNQIDDQIEKYASENNHDESQLRSTTGSGFTFAFDIEFPLDQIEGFED